MNPISQSPAPGEVQSEGVRRLREIFRKAALQGPQKAAQLVNDPALSFPQLFLLLPDLEELELLPELNIRNRVALLVLERKSGRPEPQASPDQPAPTGEQERKALKWMLDTGLNWDGPAEGYDLFDASVDAAAARLLCVHHDKSALPAVCELVFRRNRKGLLIHDLVWSLFCSCELEAPRLVAAKLLSANTQDVELACNLLHLPMPEANADVRRRLHRQYIAWLEENKNYLHFTGENYQQTAEPTPLEVDTEARYLAKRIQPKSARPAEPLTDEEWELLERFRELPEEEQELLSAFSGRLQKKNPQTWGRWIRSELSRQLETAKAEGRNQA
ncbi:hypothetical protein SDC9_100852 [bioreactor metagenome]|uniref:Uncharacterized protein n=1 Tax=bioreactor metagenome TaxID=1076179 RepID=A0A645ALQ5_9ZZZZ